LATKTTGVWSLFFPNAEGTVRSLSFVFGIDEQIDQWLEDAFYLIFLFFWGDLSSGVFCCEDFRGCNCFSNERGWTKTRSKIHRDHNEVRVQQAMSLGWTDNFAWRRGDMKIR